MKEGPVDWSELTSEKTLWEIYCKSRRIPFSKFNQVVYLLSAALLALCEYYGPTSTAELKGIVLKWAETSLGFAISILGFLMAGFTIFATLSKPELLIAMQTEVHKESGLTYLKYNFFTFVRVFTLYLSYCAIAILILLIGQSGGCPGRLLDNIGVTAPYKIFILKVIIVASGTAWMILLLSLKSFVFNIYHVAMTALRWDVENNPDKFQ